MYNIAMILLTINNTVDNTDKNIQQYTTIKINNTTNNTDDNINDNT